MSGLCQRGFGKKRKLEYLREHQNLCIHVEVFREFMIKSGGCILFGFCSRKSIIAKVYFFTIVYSIIFVKRLCENTEFVKDGSR